MTFILEREVSRETEGQMHPTQWEGAWSSDLAAALEKLEPNPHPFLQLGETAPKILIFLLKTSWQIDIPCQNFPHQLTETYKQHAVQSSLVMLSSSSVFETNIYFHKA